MKFPAECALRWGLASSRSGGSTNWIAYGEGEGSGRDGTACLRARLGRFGSRRWGYGGLGRERTASLRARLGRFGSHMVKDLLIFDMDGVLVEVSESYRETIQQTVQHFTGTRVERETIQEWKNRGGWNDDWALSHALIK